MEKICIKCKEIKDINKFSKDKYRDDGFNCYCKECRRKYYQNNKKNILEQKKIYSLKNKEKIIEIGRLYYEKNKKEIDVKNKLYYRNNKEKIFLIMEQYRQKNIKELRNKSKIYYRNNRDKIIKRNKKYVDNNREKVNKYINNKMNTDINFKLAHILRTRLRIALKRNFKKGSALVLLGCTIREFKQYLENQFIDGMSWDNHTFYGWHIDHIKPCASFDLTDLYQRKQCFHYTNLQPLWAHDNLSKGSKYIKAKVSKSVL